MHVFEILHVHVGSGQVVGCALLCCSNVAQWSTNLALGLQLAKPQTIIL